MIAWFDSRIPKGALIAASVDIENLFKIDRTIFYSPGTFTKDTRYNCFGKFVSRICHWRVILRESGLLASKSQASAQTNQNFSNAVEDLAPGSAGMKTRAIIVKSIIYIQLIR